MIAYKFLAAGAVGPFTQVAWPRPTQVASPGAWLAAAGPLPQRGVHVCTADQLACWLHDELWEVEIAGAQLPGLDCIIAERGRLLRHIAGWNATGAARFAEACLAQARAETNLGGLDVRHPDAAVRQADTGAETINLGGVDGRQADRFVRKPDGVAAAAARLADGAAAAAAGYVAVAAHCAALAVGGGEAGFAAARRWQSAWIARELIGL